ncbi:MAG: type II toxin-antitoxin system HicB family antitoxin [Thaumarchaeota archaeon]|nr:type II toxin-antitoxin system HicB family antitoxin [Nitrososphaerota archaeon]
MILVKMHTVFWKEEDTYVIKEVSTGVTTQGDTMEEAVSNIKEAVSLYLEEKPDAREFLANGNPDGAINVEIP